MELKESLKENSNNRRVFYHLETERSYRKLMELTGLPRGTIYDALRRMERAGVVERRSVKVNKVGRPITLWKAKDG